MSSKGAERTSVSAAVLISKRGAEYKTCKYRRNQRSRCETRKKLIYGANLRKERRGGVGTGGGARCGIWTAALRARGETLALGIYRGKVKSGGAVVKIFQSRRLRKKSEKKENGVDVVGWGHRFTWADTSEREGKDGVTGTKHNEDVASGSRQVNSINRS